MKIFISVFLAVMASYFAIGLLFSIYFFLNGAKKIDPGIRASKWQVRLLLIPGVIATWPLLLRKLLKVNTL